MVGAAYARGAAERNVIMLSTYAVTEPSLLYPFKMITNLLKSLQNKLSFSEF